MSRSHSRMTLIFVFILMLTSAFLIRAQENTLTPAQEAQTISPLDTEGDLMVTFPPPVYTLRDNVTVRGSVMVENLQSYFLEFRPLVIDLEETPELAESRPWFPATLPASTPIMDGELGRWNTISIPDGLYELRLVALKLDGESEVVRVSPLRVENELPPFLITPTPDRAPLLPTPTPLPGGSGTGTSGESVAPPADTSGAPRATALVDANVRRGDDTRYDRVTFLLRGESASIIGISSFGSGWYYVQLSDGQRGFIAPNTVSVSGNLGNLTLINPPPPPTPVATATPLATATPITSANLVISGQRLDPVVPVCNQSFAIYVNITNSGTGPTASSADISVTDTHIASGTVTQTTMGAVPVLQPGENFVSVMYLTVPTFFNEEHRVTITVDPNNLVPETNNADNTATIVYTLSQGACG